MPENHTVKLMGSPIFYKGYYILLQQIGADFFQAIMFSDGNYYQYHYVVPNMNGKEFEGEEIKQNYIVLLSAAQQVIDIMIDHVEKLQKQANDPSKIKN